MVAIILAAGYATRLYPINLNTPKALLEIGGKTMLDHIVDKIGGIGDIARTVIVSNDKFYDCFIEWKDKRRAAGKNNDIGKNCKSICKYICNANNQELIILNDGTTSEQTRRGAIGDIQFVIETLSLDDEAIIIAGDNFFTFQLADLYNFYRQVGADCISVKKIADRGALNHLGVAVLGPGNRVLDFEEKPHNPKSDFAVYATYIYRRDTMPLFKVYLDEGNPKDAPGNFPAWLCKKKHVAAYIFDGECYDVGTPEAYYNVCEKYGIVAHDEHG